MGLIVQKFGGTSVGTVERIQEVAQHVLRTRSQGHRVVVVVSAMSGETNRLVELAHRVFPGASATQPFARDYDTLIASGEQVSVGLVSLAINGAIHSAARGGVRTAEARPYLGHQIGMRTDSVSAKARITAIDAEMLHRELRGELHGEFHGEFRREVIPVIAGFQGVDEFNTITTLGRGGSDTSAVALAAALKADDCEIYTDVDGVYTTDPRMCPGAQKIKSISYEEMMELASLGAKVLQIRSVELAAKFKVPLHVRSSFNWNTEGTRVVGEVSQKSPMEQFVIAGVAADKNQLKFSLRGLPRGAAAMGRLFSALSQANVVVDVIVMEAAGSTLSFTVPASDRSVVEEVLSSLAPALSLQFETEAEVAKVSIVGVGMQHHPGVAARMFQLLDEAEVAIRLVSTSEIKISCIIPEAQLVKAVQRLHVGFGLESNLSPR